MKKLVLLAFALILATAPAMALSIGSWGTSPVLGFDLGNIDISVGIDHVSSGGTATYPMLLKADLGLQKIGDADTCVGIYYTTNGASSATTVIGLTWGMSANVVSNLSVGADIVIATSTSTGGTSTSDILGSAVVKTSLAL